jgi:hypothetical protein
MESTSESKYAIHEAARQGNGKPFPQVKSEKYNSV